MNIESKSKLMPKARSKGTHWKEWSDCILRISVGYSRFSGPDFEAIMSWVTTEGRFESIILLISDRLAAHNIKSIHSKSESEAIEFALKEAYEWHSLNKSIIDRAKRKSSGSVRMLGWREALELSLEAAQAGKSIKTFSELSDQLWHAYRSDECFRHFVHLDIDRFISSRRNLLSEDTISALRKTSVEYIMEELAVHSMLREYYVNACHVYPGSQLKSERYLVEKLNSEDWHNLKGNYYVNLRLE